MLHLCFIFLNLSSFVSFFVCFHCVWSSGYGSVGSCLVGQMLRGEPKSRGHRSLQRQPTAVTKSMGPHRLATASATSKIQSLSDRTVSWKLRYCSFYNQPSIHQGQQYSKQISTRVPARFMLFLSFSTFHVSLHQIQREQNHQKNAHCESW